MLGSVRWLCEAGKKHSRQLVKARVRNFEVAKSYTRLFEISTNMRAG
jgi:hypothetical protein